MPKVAYRRLNLRSARSNSWQTGHAVPVESGRAAQATRLHRVCLQHGQPAKQLQLLADRCTYCVLRAASPRFKPEPSPGLGVPFPMMCATAGSTVSYGTVLQLT